MKIQNPNPGSNEHINSKRIKFILNGVEKSIIVPPGITLLDMLHNKLNLYGTKSTCNEGDCGSCTVIIGKREDDKIIYQAVNSCLYPAVRIHNKHLITIEGIGTPDKLHPIQEALLDHHGTQCGYCTPGFVMALLALFMHNQNPERSDIFKALEGNLCRCTGYDAIFQATMHLRGKLETGNSLLPAKLSGAEEKIGKLDETVEEIVQENRELLGTIGYLQPKTINELLQFLQKFHSTEEYGLINGATDLLVQANVNRMYRPWLIDITEIPELRSIKNEGDKIAIGATVVLSEIAKSQIIQEHLPVFIKTITLIASEQIRNLATLAGNIGNASPVADTPPVLMVLDAELELTSADGKRLVKLGDYYLDYKKTALKQGEFISRIIIPKSQNGFYYHDMQKAAKRRAVDISSVNSAISILIIDERIENVGIAFGGVAPYPALAKKTMSLIEGRQLEPEWFAEAAETAVSEFTPISDVRGREDYRRVLIRNQMMNYLINCYEQYQKSLKSEKR
ncbi:MAG: FAD binding domain-containing protein [Candidatus Cloacimonetes bacterium]|nr:FAD binding domain-containing protein [Candidatus Cloacimonadota bacterium]